MKFPKNLRGLQGSEYVSNWNLLEIPKAMNVISQFRNSQLFMECHPQ